MTLLRLLTVVLLTVPLAVAASAQVFTPLPGPPPGFGPSVSTGSTSAKPPARRATAERPRARARAVSSVLVGETDNFADATDSISSGSHTGTNVGATLEAGEVPTTCQPDDGASVWWLVSIPGPGTISVDFSASGFDTVAGLYRDTWPDLPTADDEIACRDDGGPDFTSILTDIPVEAGNYVLRVSGFDGGTGPAQGAIGFDYTYVPSPATLDHFADAMSISPGTHTGTNMEATLEAGEVPTTCQPDDGASVWWLVTIPSSGTASFNFSASNFDTVVGLYSDTWPDLPTADDEIACNDDGNGATSLLSEVPVQGGRPYVLRVSGYDGGTGPAQGAVGFDYTFTPTSVRPPNDDIATAPLPEQPGTSTTGTNAGATLESIDPVPSCQSEQGASVWWAFQIDAAARLTLDFSESDFDTVVSLYTVEGSSLVEVACNDDEDVDGDILTSLLEDVPLQANTPYYIRVAGFLRDGIQNDGTISFESSFGPPTANEGGPDAAVSMSVAPNPSAGPVRLAATLPEAGAARVEVLDALGRSVALVHDGPTMAGEAAWTWDASGQPAGVYVVRLTAGGAVRTQRVTVVR